MKYFISVCSFLLLLFTFTNSWGGDTSKSIVELPTTVAIEIKKTLYQKKPPTHIMGDGLKCFIVEVDRDSLTKFIRENQRPSTRWSYGSLTETKPLIRATEWLEKWMRREKVLQEVDKVLSFKELKDRKDIFFKNKIRLNSDNFITNVTYWIIVPNQNLICFISGDT